MIKRLSNWSRWARNAAVASLVSGLSAPLLAGDWYVDAVHGDDAHSGTSAADAWKTISHAIATAPLGVVQRIHIAPGTYDSALGEVFPLQVQDLQQLVGDQGSGSTFVVGNGPGGGIGILFLALVHSTSISPDTLLEGLSVRNADSGVRFTSGGSAVLPSLRDVDVSGCAVGLELVAGGPGAPVVDVTLERVRVHGCTVGLDTQHNSPQTLMRATIRDSRIDQQATHGLFMGRGTTLVMTRSRVDHNGTHGIVTDDQGFLGVTCELEDCAITDNRSNGLECAGGLPSSGTSASVTRCTLAYNGGAGVSAGGSFSSATLRQSILYGNGDDVSPNANTSASFCDIGDGDFAGSSGNFSADPLFVDADSGDYRVRWASPCVESGDPASPPGTLDLAGNARPIDGDLDTTEVSDVGCFEFAPLFLQSTGELGTSLTLELWGPQGNATSVYFTRRPLVAAQPTPFGELDLDRPVMSIFRHTSTGAWPPTTITRPIPNDPAFAGQVFSFQALTSSSAAPQGSAWTDGVELTLVP